MIYDKSSSVTGKWVKNSEVVSGSKCQLISEVKTEPSQFKDPKTGFMKTQEVGKIQFVGSSDSLNISLNRMTIDGLVEAFGRDSKLWIGKTLTALTEKVLVGGKRVTAVYLIPDGFELKEDAEGYAHVVRIGTQTDEITAPVEPVQEEIPVINIEEENGQEIKPEDLPF